ncbi:MAG TPA: hypothetical protein PLF81_27695 [Candidatus Anammoximicrobium sp.]|nr:hypothetical protein [Candidatus Anammoximicrobium sp.]
MIATGVAAVGVISRKNVARPCRIAARWLTLTTPFGGDRVADRLAGDTWASASTYRIAARRLTTRRW